MNSVFVIIVGAVLIALLIMVRNIGERVYALEAVVNSSTIIRP